MLVFLGRAIAKEGVECERALERGILTRSILALYRGARTNVGEREGGG